MLQRKKKRKQKRKAKLEGRFSTDVDSAGRVVDRSTQHSELGGSAKRVVDRRCQDAEATASAGRVVNRSVHDSIEMSKVYASHTGIVDVNEVRRWETDSEGNSFEVVRNESKNIISTAILPQKTIGGDQYLYLCSVWIRDLLELLEWLLHGKVIVSM